MKQRNPNVDWGFYATTPRLIRTAYKDLTPVQKWLYVCLKDLCGEDGTCYRTLRVLAEETGISTGMLSESVRSLHDAGLIHAEKKRRFGTTSKEVWHITIVDIWQANATAHPTKRSAGEQTIENVHSVNNNVHSVNEDTLKRSAGEQKRSLCETEGISLSNDTIEERTIEEESDAVASPPAQNVIHLQERITDKYKAIVLSDSQSTIGNAETSKPGAEPPPVVLAPTQSQAPIDEPAPRLFPLSPSVEQASPQQTVSRSRAPKDAGTTDKGSGSRRRGGKNSQPPAPVLTDQQQHLWSLWCAVWFNEDVKPELTDIAHKHICKLAPYIITMEQMNSLTEYARKDLEASSGIKRKAVQLGNLVHCYAGWKQAQAKKNGHNGRPTLADVELVDPTWGIYRRPGDSQDWILWKEQLMLPDEADAAGYNGGFGLYA